MQHENNEITVFLLCYQQLFHFFRVRLRSSLHLHRIYIKMPEADKSKSCVKKAEIIDIEKRRTPTKHYVRIFVTLF